MTTGLLGAEADADVDEGVLRMTQAGYQRVSLGRGGKLAGGCGPTDRQGPVDGML